MEMTTALPELCRLEENENPCAIHERHAPYEASFTHFYGCCCSLINISIKGHSLAPAGI
jgi:hypothetical protein